MSVSKSKTEKIIKILLIAATVLAAIKMLFVDYSMDEEYQVVLAYRRLSGEYLFGSMWEPHQTSAFLCVGLMRIFLLLTGSYTGVLIYLRICALLIQIGICVWMYRVLSRFITSEEAALVSLLYFNIVPKLIQIPEFGSQQVWFWTGLILCFIEYDTNPKTAKNLIWIILGGICLSLEILSYPSSIVIAPIAVIFLALRAKKDSENIFKAPVTLTITCAVCATIWLASVLSHVSFDEFIRNIHYVVSFDLTHDLDVTAGGKLLNLFKGFCKETVLALAAGVIAAGIYFLTVFISKKKTGTAKALTKGQKITLISVLFILASLLIQLHYWAVLRRGFEEPQLHLFALLIVPFILWKYAGDEKRNLKFALITGIPTFLAVLYMSDLAFCFAIPHALLGCIFGMILVVMAVRKQFGSAGKNLIRLLLVISVLVCAFGKGFTLRSGRYTDITHVAGIMKHGPAVGVLADYMCAYIYNSNYEDFRNNLEEGDNVLIVTNMVFSPGTTPYMFEDYEVCHFSIVDPTSYDERLLTYWELYPSKKPDVIVVDCWYGELKEDPDNWIMKYIENDFGYSEVIDGKYVRFYKK